MEGADPPAPRPIRTGRRSLELTHRIDGWIRERVRLLARWA
ncbi:hypothetical protein ACFWYW_37240 [Nonomuraea sp. NPDC059023]